MRYRLNSENAWSIPRAEMLMTEMIPLKEVLREHSL
jgi:hypothetical protein